MPAAPPKAAHVVPKTDAGRLPPLAVPSVPTVPATVPPRASGSASAWDAAPVSVGHRAIAPSAAGRLQKAEPEALQKDEPEALQAKVESSVMRVEKNESGDGVVH